MTLGDLAGVSDERAKALLGARGPSFVRWARGEDDRPIDRSQPPRSIAREVTLTHADAPEAELAEVVRHLADVLAMRLRSMGWFARTVTLRLRRVPQGRHWRLARQRIPEVPSAAGTRPQPNRLVRSVTLREATALDEDLRAAAASLLKVLWRRQPVGGLGLVLSNLQPTGPQMPLFPLVRSGRAPEPRPTRCGCGRAFACWSISATSRAVCCRVTGRGRPRATACDASVERQLPLRHRKTGLAADGLRVRGKLAACPVRRSARAPLRRPGPKRAAGDAGDPRAALRPASERDHRARFHDAVRAPRRDDPLGAVVGRAREPGHAGVLHALSGSAAARRRHHRGARTADRGHRASSGRSPRCCSAWRRPCSSTTAARCRPTWTR